MQNFSPLENILWSTCRTLQQRAKMDGNLDVVSVLYLVVMHFCWIILLN